MASRRRRFLQSTAVYLGLGLTGCTDAETAPGGTETTEPPRTEATTTSGTTPAYSPPELEIRNLADEPLVIEVALTKGENPPSTESSERALYAETVELASPDTLDLRPYRVQADLYFILAIESNVLFEDLVEPHEGHSIEIWSKSDVDVETSLR